MQCRYETVLREVGALSKPQQLRLLAHLNARLMGRISDESRTSILELQGLGREVWRDQDAQRYVNGERSSWNG